MIMESANTVLESWKSRIEAKGGVADMKIDQDMISFSGDVISRACFGSNYSDGEEIFNKLRALQKITSERILVTGIPGMRCSFQKCFLNIIVFIYYLFLVWKFENIFSKMLYFLINSHKTNFEIHQPNKFYETACKTDFFKFGSIRNKIFS